jgi:putative ABC transport system ATP-binding protein
MVEKAIHGPVIAVDNVSLTYGAGHAAMRALKGVSLDVNSGEVLLVMGPSGSGKTSLLQLLGGLLRPTTGHVRIDGETTTGLDQDTLSRIRLERIGFVFQHHQLLRALRAWENVAIALELVGIKPAEIEPRSRNLLATMGIADRANAYPSQLSGGEQQRVAIARALASEPGVILADEPTAALDSHSGGRVGEVLKSIAHRDGRAVVIVTHDHRLLRFADRIAVLEDGRIVRVESAASLLEAVGI